MTMLEKIARALYLASDWHDDTEPDHENTLYMARAVLEAIVDDPVAQPAAKDEERAKMLAKEIGNAAQVTPLSWWLENLPDELAKAFAAVRAEEREAKDTWVVEILARYLNDDINGESALKEIEDGVSQEKLAAAIRRRRP
jgi:hypothetical protein